MDQSSINPYAPPTAESKVPRRVTGTFCGLQGFWIESERFYKFYIRDDGLYGAWISGQFFSPLTVRSQLWALYPTIVGAVISEAAVYWTKQRRQRLEQQYDALADQPEIMLPRDHRNLYLPKKAIAGIRITTDKCFWALWVNSGVIWIRPPVGKPLQFYVLDDRPLGDIVKDLSAAGYPVEFKA